MGSLRKSRGVGLIGNATRWRQAAVLTPSDTGAFQACGSNGVNQHATRIEAHEAVLVQNRAWLLLEGEDVLVLVTRVCGALRP